jgi:hypothetical protein
MTKLREAFAAWGPQLKKAVRKLVTVGERDDDQRRNKACPGSGASVTQNLNLTASGSQTFCNGRRADNPRACPSAA